jgi:adenine-specific DNA methylase
MLKTFLSVQSIEIKNIFAKQLKQTFKKYKIMKTQNTDIFATYNTLEISKELRIKIRNLKNDILKAQHPNGCFTTEEHEEVLNQACLAFGIIL